MSVRLAMLSVASLFVLAGCFGDRSRFANMPSDSVPLVLGPGDIQIANVDSSMELGLAGDKVFMRFGEKVRRQLRRDLDTAKESGSGIGATIARAVKSRVGSMLNRRLEYALADIDSVTYDGERLVFAYRVHHSPDFEGMKSDNRPVLSTFAPDDARRFVEAVRARKR